MDSWGPKRKLGHARRLWHHLQAIEQKRASNRSTYRRLMRFYTGNAGGRRAPYRVNIKRNAAWVPTGRRYYSKDDRKLATRGYVKQKLDLDNVGKEVTFNTSGITSGSSPVTYRLCKNIDQGTAQAGRSGAIVKLLGFRVFGSIRLDLPAAEPVHYRFLLVRDKTPGRSITEAFFTTNGDSRDPLDFPTGTGGPITAVRPLNTDRWHVYADWVERLGAGDQTPNNGSCITFNRYFPLNEKIAFNPSYNTVSYDVTPSIYFMYFTVADGGATTVTCTQSMQFEEYFTK